MIDLLHIAASSAPAAHVFAAPQIASAPAATTASGLGAVALALALVLGAIFALAWLARRVRGTGGRAAGALDVLAQVQLGPKERAVLIKVGATQLLLGVAPGRVNALHVLTEPVPTNPPAAPDRDDSGRPNFRALLLRSLGKS
ncbi:MAG TPA: flagellar biosynthetic protein FliO [Steroidobacteraceae bacterium]|nr:flagellar biosynthetic protein FliO [Steroidobacteraceae bacterium]